MNVDPALVSGKKVVETCNHSKLRSITQQWLPSFGWSQPAPDDAGLDASVVTRLPASAKVVGLVGEKLAGDSRDGSQHTLQRFAVVGTGQPEGERDAFPVGKEVPLGAGPARVLEIEFSLSSWLNG